jgi:hypothetical protein
MEADVSIQSTTAGDMSKNTRVVDISGERVDVIDMANAPVDE